MIRRLMILSLSHRLLYNSIPPSVHHKKKEKEDAERKYYTQLSVRLRIGYRK